MASDAVGFLHTEALALMSRLDLVQPFALTDTMVPAAALMPAAQSAIEAYLVDGRNRLREAVGEFIRWSSSAQARRVDPSVAQRRFTFLRLRFNVVLTHLDIFAHAISQRSEHRLGVWLSGMDMAAQDAIRLPGVYEPPPIICYLERGGGGAIRRARTRLPGGGHSPVAVIRMPRERMVGTGIASSLFHEVGHQAAALLNLATSLHETLGSLANQQRPEAIAWQLWDRWLNEILADFWAIARVGIGSTLGLIGIVSLPRVFVFRLSTDDPHPVPWLRVRLSCAIGAMLFPDPQWQELERVWMTLYPKPASLAGHGKLFDLLESTMPSLVSLIANHRPRSLGGRSLREVLEVERIAPWRLRQLWPSLARSQRALLSLTPCVALAAVSQARSDRLIDPARERELVGTLLTHWALRGTLDMSQFCANAKGGAVRLAALA
jgi:hypothetical protein